MITHTIKPNVAIVTDDSRHDFSMIDKRPMGMQLGKGPVLAYAPCDSKSIAQHYGNGY
jgi:hypothetical protein